MLLTPRVNKFIFQRGGSLVEIVIVIGIMMGSLIVILGLASLFLTTSYFVEQTGQATLLAQELLEVVRNYRDGTDWSSGLGVVTFAPDMYHVEQVGIPPEWTLVSGSETVNEFTRFVQFEEVERDANDDIVESGGTLDPSTLKATATVTWEEHGRSHQVELTAYFTDWSQ